MTSFASAIVNYSRNIRHIMQQYIHGIVMNRDVSEYFPDNQQGWHDVLLHIYIHTYQTLYIH